MGRSRGRDRRRIGSGTAGAVSEAPEGDAVGEVGDDGDDRGLDAVVEAEQPGRLQHRVEDRPGPVRRHARVDTGEQRDEHREGDRDVQQPEQPPEPPGGPVEQREAAA